MSGANSLKVGDPVLEGGGGRGRGAGKKKRKGFILLLSVPAVSRGSLAAQETTVTITTASGGLWGHLCLCMYLWCCSLVHSLSASKENWSKWFGPVSIMGLLPFLKQVGRSFCSSLQVRDHHQALGAAVLAGPTRGSQAMPLSEDKGRCESAAVLLGNVLSNGPGTAQPHPN